MPKKAKVKPTYMKGNRPLRIALHDVVRVVQMIEAQGHTEKFQKAAKANKAFVSVGADTVNFVKDFLAKNELHEDPVAGHIINARAVAAADPATTRRDRFDCDFGRG